MGRHIVKVRRTYVNEYTIEMASEAVKDALEDAIELAARDRVAAWRTTGTTKLTVEVESEGGLRRRFDEDL